MVSSTSQTADETVTASQFPLFPDVDFDLTLAYQAFPIGISSTYPSEYQRRLAGAATSFFAGLRSVDYTLKAYLHDRQYPRGSSDRTDLKISREIRHFLEGIPERLHPHYAKEGDPIGSMLCEMTIVRACHSVRAALTLANRGLLFETSAVCRMLLEQIGWAYACHGVVDVDLVRDSSATRSIGRLQAIYPTAGRFYGWLSHHAHWHYTAHVKMMSVGQSMVTTILASSRFKAEALGLVLVITDCLAAVLESLYMSKLDRLSVIVAAEDGNSYVADRMTKQLMLTLSESAPEGADLSEIRKFLP